MKTNIKNAIFLLQFQILHSRNFDKCRARNNTPIEITILNLLTSIVEILVRTIAGPESTLPVKVPIKSNIINILERAIAAPESTYHPKRKS